MINNILKGGTRLYYNNKYGVPLFKKKREKMPGWEQLGMQAAGDAQSALLGLALEGHNDQRQLKQTGKLLEQQAAVDRSQTQFNQQIGLDTWRQTGPVGMREELEKAGLSPALYYGKGGGGAQSMGLPGASVNGAKAPAGGGEIMGLQLMGAQKALIEAQTRKTEAEAVNTGAQTELTNVQTKFEKQRYQMYIDSYQTSFGKLLDEAEVVKQQAKIIKNDAEISDATKDEKIALMEGELIGQGLTIEAKKAGIELTEAQVNQVVESVKQGWKSLNIQEQNSIIAGERLALDKFVKDVPDSIKLTVETVKDVINDIVDFKQQKRRQDWNERERTSTTSKRWGKNWSETEKTGNH